MSSTHVERKAQQRLEVKARRPVLSAGPSSSPPFDSGDLLIFFSAFSRSWVFHWSMKSRFNSGKPLTQHTIEESIEKAEDFKYLGSWIGSTGNKVNVWKAKAWASGLPVTSSRGSGNPIWRLCEKLKPRLFVATVETVLLYGCKSWTLSKQLQKNLNGTYTIRC